MHADEPFEARYGPQLLAAVGQAVIATDREGRILFWNGAAETLYGWTSEEVLGRPVVDVTPSTATREQAEQIMEALREGRDWTGEFEVRRRDGSTFLALVVDKPLYDGDRMIGVVGLSSDVTEARRAMATVQRSEQRLRALFESIDEGYCLCEMIVGGDGVATDYRFLEVNPLFESMTGLHEPVGRTALQLVPNLERVWIDTYARVGVDRQTLRFQQGSQAMGRFFDVFAVPVEPDRHFALVFKDITAQRRTEDELRESEHRFRSMTDQLPMLVWKHDAAGALEWVNETYCTYFGVTRAQMQDDEWRVLTHEDDTAAYAEAFGTAVRERSSFHAEVRAFRHDDQWRWLESWAEPQYSIDGTYVGHLGTSVDVTDRKQAEETLRRNHARADLLAALLGALEGAGDTPSQLQRLVEVLAGRLCDRATVEVPGSGEVYAAGVSLNGHPVRRLSVPLRLPGQVRAVMTVMDLSGDGRGRLSDVDGLEAFLEQVVERIEQALAVSHAHRQEHDIAVRLQKSLLPDTLVTHRSLRISARYVAGNEFLEVGGDWYDTFAWPDGRVGIMVGDVVGHNMDSAAAMGRLRAAGAAMATFVPSRPAAMLDALESFARGPNGTDFVTAACVVIDPATGLMTYSSAGHPPILLAQPGRHPVRLNGAASRPMCVPYPTDGGGARPEDAVRLEPGAVALLYSDGLVERRGETLNSAIDRLCDVIARLAGRPVPDLVDGVVSGMLDGSPTDDDIVVIAVGYEPATSAMALTIPS